MAVGTRMQQRRATEAVWTTANPVLAAGELGVTTDSGIIKIGDGVNTWVDLDPAFQSQYLPVLGKASDSELLDGISASGFLQVTEADTAPTADKIARRLSDGKLRAVAGATTDEVVNYAQMVAADEVVRKTAIGRTLTAASTLLATDMYNMILINHGVRTTVLQLTIPTNATTPIAIGSWFAVYSFGIGTGNVVPAAGVTLRGDGRVYGNFGVIHILKINTDTWVVTKRSDPTDAYARAFMYMDTGVTGRASGWQHISLNAESLDTHNGHTIGSVTGDDTDSSGKQTNRYVIQPGQAGTYKVSGMSSMISGTATAQIQSRILKNGAVLAGAHGASNTAGNSSQALTGEKMHVMAEGDWFSMQAYCSVGGWESYTSENSSGGSTSWMSVERIA